MDALSPGGRPSALRPVAGGAKAHLEDARARHAIREGVREDASGADAARDGGTVVRLSDEALALAARARSGQSARGEGQPGTSEAQDRGAGAPLSPAERATILERFTSAHEPRPEARLIDARA